MSNVWTTLCCVCNSLLPETEPSWKCAKGCICSRCVESVLDQTSRKPGDCCATCRHAGEMLNDSVARRWCLAEGHLRGEFGTWSNAWCPRFEVKQDWAQEAVEEICAWMHKNAGYAGLPYRVEWAAIIRKRAPKEAKP
jgi:hypothetical protein